MKALARRIRLALHRHDPIECWCELTAADAHQPSLPVQPGPVWCTDCWALPGETHQLSCQQVTPEQFRAYLAAEREQHERQARRDLQLGHVERWTAFVAALLATALIWGWLL
ncbi:hypothetical protein AB0C02_27890 [Micromonospora sp. NPDC048999]|uniref:hypothetical protein n=1 Tax=Micromonospora sp. NPDC048999 TaxID=3155391 RepID=UPI0033DD969A